MSKKKLTAFIINLDLILAGICFAALVVITFAGVLMRYVFNAPFIWQEEVQLWLFLWVVFFAGSAAFRSKNHVEIEILVELFPPVVQRALAVFVYGIVVAVLGYLMLQSGALMSQFITTGKSTSILKISSPFIYSAVPICCALMILNHSVAVFKDIFGKKDGEDEQE